ncbi:MAG: hypothetical protein NC120_10680 [Ruminococcus sp.]|nr:hypothetical protein [Ruminococcus sp.]
MTMTVTPAKRRRYRIRRVYSAPAAPVRDITPAQKLYILLTVICMGGVFTGAYSYSSYPCGADTLIFPADGPAEAFTDSLGVGLVYLLICFFSGLSAAGKPIGYILCAVKGLAAGYLSCCAMSTGNAAAVLDVLPFQAVCTVTVILAARENIRLSEYISGRSFGGVTESGDKVLWLYLSKFGIIFLTAAAAAAADCLVYIAANNV